MEWVKEEDYGSETGSLGDIRQGLYRSWAGKNWWRRNRAHVVMIAVGVEYTLLVGLIIWACVIWGSQLRHPLPLVRDYPYILRGESRVNNYWVAKGYHQMPDGTIVVLNEEVMVKHNSLGDQGCYALPDNVPQLEFAPNSVIVEER